jgi:hypothetical protein
VNASGPVSPWTPEEDAVLRAVYEDDSIASPFPVACAKLPNRGPSSISFRVSIKGIAAARRARQGKPPIAKRATPQKANAASPAVEPPRVVKIKPGPCDRGEREAIRRRLVNATIPAFSRELQRSPDAIASALRELAADGFRPPKSLNFTAEEIEGAVLGQDRGKPNVRVRRGSVGQ